MKAWMLMRGQKPYRWECFATKKLARQVFLENVPTYIGDVRVERVEITLPTDELAELSHLFDFQYRRMKEATALWRRENPGNDLVIPDLGTLLAWLMERGGK